MPRNHAGLPLRARLDGLQASPKPDAKPGDGSFQAMDQVAHWVRFADTKATILTAGLGVVMTMLMTNSGKVVAALKDKGLTSPYLRPFVIARINPIRFSKSTEFDFDEVMDKMIASAGRFNVDRVKQEDVAKVGGAPPDES